MKLPWIRRSTHRQLEYELDALCAHRDHLLDKLDERQEVARIQEDAIASLKRRCAELQGTVDRLLKEGSTYPGRIAAAEKAAEIWEERCHEANLGQSCPACSAKDQTIALMADVVDFERARAMQPHQPSPNATGAVQLVPTRPEEVEERQWITDDEEHVMAALQSGALGSDPEEAHEQASKMLAAIGAQNVEVEVVRK